MCRSRRHRIRRPSVQLLWTCSAEAADNPLPMPHDFEPESLASYLHISPQQVLKMAERGSVPGRKIGGQWRFSQAEIHHWLEERIGAADVADLAHVQGLLDKAAEFKEPATVRISELLLPEAVAIPLPARTRSSVIKSMVE